MPHPDVMMMSLTEPKTQALGSIADGLAGSDPRLASMPADGNGVPLSPIPQRPPPGRNSVARKIIFP